MMSWRLQRRKQGHVCTRLMHGQTTEGKEERSKGGVGGVGISRVRCKIFSPPSINQPRRDGNRNTACTVHPPAGGGWRGVGVGGAFPSSSFRIQLSIFLNDVIAVSLSLHLHLHLLPPSFQGFLRLARTRSHVLPSALTRVPHRNIRCILAGTGGSI